MSNLSDPNRKIPGYTGDGSNQADEQSQRDLLNKMFAGMASALSPANTTVPFSKLGPIPGDTEAQRKILEEMYQKSLSGVTPPFPTAERSVIEKIKERVAKGLAKYGVTTDRKDLTHAQWLKHAQEEAMDLAVYLEKVMGECAPVSRDVEINHKGVALKLDRLCMDMLNALRDCFSATPRISAENLKPLVHEWSSRRFEIIEPTLKGGNSSSEDPYQCYWSRRALDAEAKLKDVKKELETAESYHRVKIDQIGERLMAATRDTISWVKMTKDTQPPPADSVCIITFCGVMRMAKYNNCLWEMRGFEPEKRRFEAVDAFLVIIRPSFLKQQ